MPAIRRVNPDPLIYERQGDTSVLRPQAAPVETFVRPAEPQKSGATDLAEALVGIRPTINKFLVDKADDIAYDTAREAESKAMMSTAKTWDEAIAKGEVSAGASPLYQRVYEETLGKLHGMNEAQAKLWQEWVSPDNKIRNTQNPAEIGQWFSTKRQELLAGKSVDFQKGLGPMLNQVQQQLTQRIISDNIKAIEQGNHDALGQLFMDRILAGKAAGQSPAQIAAQLADDALPQKFAGMQGKEINQIAAKAIIGASQKLKDPNILQVGYSDRPDIRNPGQTIRGVFSIPDFGNAAESARTAILQHQATQEQRAMYAEARAEKRVAQQTLGTWVQNASKDPNWEPSQEDIAAAVKADPHIMSNFRVQQRALKEPKLGPNLGALAHHYPLLIDEIKAGGNISDRIGQMIADRAFTTPSEIEGAYKLRDQLNNKEDTIFRSTPYKVMDDALKNAQSPLERRIDSVSAAARIGALRGTLFQAAIEYQRMNKGAGGKFDPDDFNKYIQEKGEALLKSLEAIPPTKKEDGTALPTTAPPPQQQGAAPPAGPANPSSLSGVINIEPVGASAANMQWPTAPKGTQWDFPATMKISDPGALVAQINALRRDPKQPGPDGRPLWQSVEQAFGPGSVGFFMSSNPNTIAQRIQKRAAPSSK